MKLQTVTFAVLQIFSCVVAAHPFIIVATRVKDVAPTHIHHRRQGFFDSLESAVDGLVNGDDDDDVTLAPAATRSAVSLPAPVTASATDSSEDSAPTSTDSDEDSNNSDESEDQGSASTSDSEESSSTEQPTSTRRSSSTAETSSPSSTSSQEPTSQPTPAIETAASTATASASNSEGDNDKDDDNSGGVPSGGIAVAVVMILLILSITAFLIFRYHPKCQAWWAVRQEKARQERTYRQALDGGGLSASPSLRQQALAGGASKRQTRLHSFFAPATARLSATTEIRRKPVNWSEPSTPVTPRTPAFNQSREVDSERLPMGASAAPMGQIERFSAVQAPLPVLASVPDSTPTQPLAALTAVVTPQTRSRSISRSNTTRSESAARAPVSPMSLHPQKRASFEALSPISPSGTLHQPFESLSTVSNTTPADRTLPILPPLPIIPALSHAKRGSDGVFRLT